MTFTRTSGWFPGASVFGLRLDGDYFSMGGRETDCPNCPGAKGFQLGLDGSASLPARPEEPG